MNTKGAAMRYYPDLGYVAAVRRFRQEIRDTQGLLDALIGLGYEGSADIPGWCSHIQE